MLLSNGVDINLLDENENFFFYVVCGNGYFNIVKLLLENNVKVNLFIKDGFCFLLIVCYLEYV